MAFIEMGECTPENGKTCASEIIPQNTVVFAAHGGCKKNRTRRPSNNGVGYKQIISSAYKAMQIFM